MQAQKDIEVEVRSLLNEEKYKEIKKFLKDNATEDLGEDNKDVYFFLMSEKVIKVVNNISKKTAKIVIKMTRVGKGGHDTEEIEIPINPSDFEKSIKLFSSLEFEQIQHSFQKRHNYMFEDVEIALKYSDSWGYHIELEIMIREKKHQLRAERMLHEVANILGVKVMTAEEQKKLAVQIDKTYT